jgi:uncharacterized protein DUF551
MNKFRDIEKEGIVIINHTACAHQWISVKDRLPEKEKKVLVYAKYFETTQDSLTKYGDWLDSDPQANITHWMPLPEPPKENE